VAQYTHQTGCGRISRESCQPLQRTGSPRAQWERGRVQEVQGELRSHGDSSGDYKEGSSDENDSCNKSHVQATKCYKVCVKPLLKKPPEAPEGWSPSAKEDGVLSDYLRDMEAE